MTKMASKDETIVNIVITNDGFDGYKKYDRVMEPTKENFRKVCKGFVYLCSSIMNTVSETVNKNVITLSLYFS